jgi:hypothetical protein
MMPSIKEIIPITGPVNTTMGIIPTVKQVNKMLPIKMPT